MTACFQHWKQLNAEHDKLNGNNVLHTLTLLRETNTKSGMEIGSFYEECNFKTIP